MVLTGRRDCSADMVGQMEDINVDGTRRALDCWKRAHSIHVGIQSSRTGAITRQALPESVWGLFVASGGVIVFLEGGDMEEEQGGR